MILETYLYIKQHEITGLKYFGKTTRNPYNYTGSGKYWKRHIKKYGKEHVKTIAVYGPYTDKVYLEKQALAMSDWFNIVESPEFANMKPENGLDGGSFGHTEETRAKMSAAKKGKNKGKNKSEETRAKISSSMKGKNKGKNKSEETRAKISSSMKGKNKGKTASDETRAKMSAAKQNISEETRAKISAAKQGIPIPIITCPHCGKSGGLPLMKSWHFDNCKQNQRIIKKEERDK